MAQIEPEKNPLLTVVSDQASNVLNSETIILNLLNNKYYGLEGLGSQVWEWLKQPIRFQEIENKILTEYDVDSKTCREDLQELLQLLCQEKLIDIKND